MQHNAYLSGYRFADLDSDSDSDGPDPAVTADTNTADADADPDQCDGLVRDLSEELNPLTLSATSAVTLVNLPSPRASPAPAANAHVCTPARPPMKRASRMLGRDHACPLAVGSTTCAECMAQQASPV